MIHSRAEVGKTLIRIILIIWFASEVLLGSTIERYFSWNKNTINLFMAVVVLALLMMQIVFFQEYTFKALVLIGLATIPIVMGAINSGNNNLLSTWLFILAAKYIDIDDIVKLSYIVLLLTIPIVLYMYFSGYITEITLVRHGMVRHSWGFTHPNGLGMRVFQVVIAHCYIFRRKAMIPNLIIIFLASYFVYRVPNCQTAYYALIILAALIILEWLFGLLVNGRDFYAKMLVIIAAVANVMSVVLSFIRLRKGTFFYTLDLLLSKRFSQCHRTMKYFGLSPFGKEIDLYTIRMNSSLQIFHLDTAYMTIMLRYGYVVYAIFSVFFLVTMIKCISKKKYMLMIVYCMYAIYGIMEKNFFMMSQNIFLFAMSYTLFSREFPEEEIDRKREVLKIEFSRKAG